MTTQPSDLLVWPCGTYAERDRFLRSPLAQMVAPKTDFVVLAEGTAEWLDFCIDHDLIEPVSPARQLNYHYNVEQRPRDRTYHGDTTVIASFHSRRDADRFLQVSIHPHFEHRIVRTSNRGSNAKSPDHWR